MSQWPGESKDCLMQLFALSSPNLFTASCCCQVANPTLLSFGLLLSSPFSLFPFFFLASFSTISCMILLMWMEPKGRSSIANGSERNPDHSVFCHLCICSRSFFMNAQDFLMLCIVQGSRLLNASYVEVYSDPSANWGKVTLILQ